MSCQISLDCHLASLTDQGHPLLHPQGGAAKPRDLRTCKTSGDLLAFLATLPTGRIPSKTKSLRGNTKRESAWQVNSSPEPCRVPDRSCLQHGQADTCQRTALTMKHGGVCRQVAGGFCKAAAQGGYPTYLQRASRRILSRDGFRTLFTAYQAIWKMRVPV